jgi:hypothetical protein
MPLKCAIYLMVLIVLFLLAGVIPGHDGVAVGIFQSPMFILLGVFMVIGVVATSVRRQLAASQIPFWLAHAGIALVLVGGAVDHFWGVSHQLVMPLHEPPSRQFQSVGTKMKPGGMGAEMPEMPFMMRLSRLEIFSYDPKRYQVYQAKPTSDGGSEFKRIGEVAPMLDIVKGPDEQPVSLWIVDLAKVPGLGKEWENEKIPVGQLVPDKGSRLRRQVPLGEVALECDTPPDQTIDVAIEFNEGKEMPVLGNRFKQWVQRWCSRLHCRQDMPNQSFTINHPAVYQGWRFYMMDYDRQQFQWAMITARHDPGRSTVIAGLWLVILGVAGLCFWRRRPGPTEPPSRPGPSSDRPPRDGNGPRRPRWRRRRSGGPDREPMAPAGTPREGGN